MIEVKKTGCIATVIINNETKRNALNLNIPLETEIKQLILHGILHLIGYTDTNSFDKTYMLDEQNRLLTLIDDN